MLRRDRDLNHIHWTTTRDALTRASAHPDRVMALAIDHRMQLEAMADEAGVPRSRIDALKVLALEAAVQVAQGRPGFGMLLDGTYGQEALFRAVDHPLWIGRPVEKPGSRPLEFEGNGSLGAFLSDWPLGHTVKCLCFTHPDDPVELTERQDRELLRVYDAVRKQGRELLVEIIAGKHGPLADDTVATVMRRLYAKGIKPDWWKLEGQPSAAAWEAVTAAVANNDPYCRGIMLLGLDAPLDQLTNQFRLAAAYPIVKGFAVGRSVFGAPAKAWFAGRMGDEAVRQAMAERFSTLVEAWLASRGEVVS